MKSNKRRVFAKIFLCLTIIVMVALAAGAAYWSTLQDWMPVEFTFELPFEIKTEHLVMGAGVVVVLLLLTIVLFVAAARRDKALAEAACEEEELEEECYCEEPVAQEAVEVVSVEKEKKNFACKINLKEIKEHAVETWKSEKVQKVVKVAAPIVGTCVVTAAVASMLNTGAKTKRRHQFYRWLG